MTKLKRIPDVIQDESAECGLAAISYISGLYGRPVPLYALRNKYDVPVEGLSFFHMMKICRDYGMIATGLQVKPCDIQELAIPSVLLWNNCHFVVLTSVSAKGIKVMDPAVGTRQFSMSEVEAFFSGMALEVTQADSEQQPSLAAEKPKQQASAFSFLNGARKYKAYIAPLAVLTIVIQLTNLAIPKLTSLVFDEVIPNNDEDFLYLLLYIFGFIYFINSISGYLKIVVSHRLRRFISYQEGLSIVHKLFSMNLRYFNKRMPPDILRTIKAVDVLHINYTNGWIDIFIETIFTCLLFALLFLISFKLALIIMILSLTMVLIRIIFLPAILSRQYSAIDAEIKRDNVLLGSIDTINAVKIGHTEHRKINSWFTHHADMEHNRSSIEHASSLIELFINVFSNIQTLVITGLGAYYVLKGENSAGHLISFILYKNIIVSNLQSMIEKHTQLRLCEVEIRRMQDIDPDPATPHEEFKHTVRENVEVVKNVTVSDLGFGYNNLDDRLFSHLHFTIGENEKIAIIGPSGCGKTTILNLLSGLLAPTEGTISINGIELTRFGISQFHQQIAFVTPDDKLLNGTVIENIIYESDHYDMSLLDESIEKSGFADVVRQLPSGLNTRLGTNGSRLSSGQQQRLMLARALYRRPRLLLLDEPTSHLDSEAKKQVITQINALSVMCIIVTHDRELIASVDKCIELEKLKHG